MNLVIDTRLIHGPRVTKLASLCGWGRHETLGALLDVWALAEEVWSHLDDVVTLNLWVADVDGAAEFDGFAAAMVKAQLAYFINGELAIAFVHVTTDTEAED